MYPWKFDIYLKTYIILFVLAVVYVLFFMQKAESLVYIQEIKGKELSKEDTMAINSNFRNLNQMKQDRNFEVRTATPTTTNFTHQGIVLGNLTGSGNKRLFININGTLYNIILIAN